MKKFRAFLVVGFMFLKYTSNCDHNFKTFVIYISRNSLLYLTKLLQTETTDNEIMFVKILCHNHSKFPSKRDRFNPCCCIAGLSCSINSSRCILNVSITYRKEWVVATKLENIWSDLSKLNRGLLEMFIFGFTEWKQNKRS